MRKFLQKIKEIKTGTLQYTRNKYDSRRLIHGLKWTRGKKNTDMFQRLLCLSKITVLKNFTVGKDLNKVTECCAPSSFQLMSEY